MLLFSVEMGSIKGLKKTEMEKVYVCRSPPYLISKDFHPSLKNLQLAFRELSYPIPLPQVLQKIISILDFWEGKDTMKHIPYASLFPETTVNG